MPSHRASAPPKAAAPKRPARKSKTTVAQTAAPTRPSPQAMSASHRAALATARTQNRAIRRYLEALDATVAACPAGAGVGRYERCPPGGRIRRGAGRTGRGFLADVSLEGLVVADLDWEGSAPGEAWLADMDRLRPGVIMSRNFAAARPSAEPAAREPSRFNFP